MRSREPVEVAGTIRNEKTRNNCLRTIAEPVRVSPYEWGCVVSRDGAEAVVPLCRSPFDYCDGEIARGRECTHRAPSRTTGEGCADINRSMKQNGVRTTVDPLAGSGGSSSLTGSAYCFVEAREANCTFRSRESALRTTAFVHTAGLPFITHTCALAGNSLSMQTRV